MSTNSTHSDLEKRVEEKYACEEPAVEDRMDDHVGVLSAICGTEDWSTSSLGL